MPVTCAIIHHTIARTLSQTELKDFAATVLRTLLCLVRPLDAAVDDRRACDLDQDSDEFPGGTPQDARDYAQVCCVQTGGRWGSWVLLGALQPI